MPARVTIYCRKSVIRVTAGEILAGLEIAATSVAGKK